jgi:hypothetical protein
VIMSSLLLALSLSVSLPDLLTATIPPLPSLLLLHLPRLQFRLASHVPKSNAPIHEQTVAHQQRSVTVLTTHTHTTGAVRIRYTVCDAYCTARDVWYAVCVRIGFGAGWCVGL